MPSNPEATSPLRYPAGTVFVQGGETYGIIGERRFIFLDGANVEDDEIGDTWGDDWMWDRLQEGSLDTRTAVITCPSRLRKYESLMDLERHA